MYAVVGCSDCSALWVVAGRPPTTQCPRCGKRRQFGKLKQFVTTDDPDEAKQARAAMLADRQGHGEDFENLDHFATMELSLDDAGVDDEAYLEASGIDADSVAEAGERAGQGRGGSQSRTETVRAALSDLDDPTEDAIVGYAAERGVPESAARDLLEKLVRAGEAVENRGTYRLL